MEKLFFTSVLFLLLVSVINAGFKFAGNVKNFKVENDRVEFVLDNAMLNIYVVENNIIRIRYTDKNKFDEAPSYAVIYKNNEQQKFNFKEEDNKFVLSTAELTVHITKSPCRISIYDNKMNLINADEKSFGAAFDEGDVRCFKQLFSDERFFGLGEKSDDLVKNGKQYTMWNTDYPAYTSKKDELYESIPFFIGVRNYKAYGIFLDNTYKSHFNMGASNNRFYWFGAEGGELNYYFIYGPEMKRVISDYTKLTGKMELPPMWALGYQQSRWSYYPESTVRRIAKEFRDYQIPCDVIYLDIHYMDGYRVFTFDKNRFPDPAKMLSDLKSEGFKIVPIIDPGVKADSNYFAAKEGLAKDLFAKYPDGVPYEGEVWPSWAYFPDFTKKETRDWWGEKLSAFLKLGIEGFWNDMNEPATWGQSFPDIVLFNDNGFGADHKKIHNVYGLLMARATREGLRKYSYNRHFILTRAGFSGIQRYSAVWTGDNEATEEHLRLACTMPLNMGISGIPFVGSDVGGFIGEPSNDLYVRWIELGSFTPFFRGHSAIDTRAHEPFAFNENVMQIAKETIQLRYKLLPFWYNEFYNSSQTGLPIMRPMFLNYQDDENCYYTNAQYQFMIGENLLVAPVVNSYDRFKKLYLPSGEWYDWNNNKKVIGGNWIIVEVPIDKIPLYVKAGGIIPMQQVQNYVGEKKMEELDMLIFPSGKSEYSLYEDDGETYKYEDGKYSLTKFSMENSAGNISLTVSKIKNGFKTDRKKYLFSFVQIDKPGKVVVDNKILPEENVKYDSSKRILDIMVDDTNNFKLELFK